jgi:dihydrofolate reductase
MVAALTREHVIGRDGKLPWHLPEDMAHFRRVTRGHAVIMGRRSWDEVGKPLPKRRNIVVSRDRSLRLEGAEVVPSVAEAIALARETDDEPCILGGAKIYAEALPLATRMILTWVHEPYEGDTRFPDFDPNDWTETERREGEGLTFVTLERKT